MANQMVERDALWPSVMINCHFGALYQGAHCNIKVSMLLIGIEPQY